MVRRFRAGIPQQTQQQVEAPPTDEQALPQQTGPRPITRKEAQKIAKNAQRSFDRGLAGFIVRFTQEEAQTDPRAKLRRDILIELIKRQRAGEIRPLDLALQERRAKEASLKTLTPAERELNRILEEEGDFAPDTVGKTVEEVQAEVEARRTRVEVRDIPAQRISFATPRPEPGAPARTISTAEQLRPTTAFTTFDQGIRTISRDAERGLRKDVPIPIFGGTGRTFTVPEARAAAGREFGTAGEVVVGLVPGTVGGALVLRGAGAVVGTAFQPITKVTAQRAVNPTSTTFIATGRKEVLGSPREFITGVTSRETLPPRLVESGRRINFLTGLGVKRKTLPARRITKEFSTPLGLGTEVTEKGALRTLGFVQTQNPTGKIRKVFTFDSKSISGKGVGSFGETSLARITTRELGKRPSAEALFTGTRDVSVKGFTPFKTFGSVFQRRTPVRDLPREIRPDIGVIVKAPTSTAKGFTSIGRGTSKTPIVKTETTSVAQQVSSRVLPKQKPFKSSTVVGKTPRAAVVTSRTVTPTITGSTRQISETRSISAQATSPKVKVTVRTTPKTRTTQAITPNVRARTKAITDVLTRQDIAQATVPRIKTPRTPNLKIPSPRRPPIRPGIPRPPTRRRPPRTPTPPRIPILPRGRTTSPLSRPTTEVSVRRGGIFRSIGRFSTLRGAVRAGSQRVGTTLAATFRISGPRTPSELPGFRSRSVRGGTLFVEPRRRRLSTRTETKEISRSKKKKRRKKR